MLHPVGTLPPAIYWRRRILLIALPLFLVLLVLWALLSGGGGGAGKKSANAGTRIRTPAATGSGGNSSKATSSTAPASMSRSATSSPATSAAKTSATSAPKSATKSATKSPSATTSAGDLCSRGDLRVQAATSSSSFASRSRPTFYLQVTNKSKHGCRADLSDKQVQLVVRSGDARIWGSHDCKVQPGTDVVTLLPDAAVRRGIKWSGRSSVPGCTGTRLYPQAGTYQLYATLSGQGSKPVTFTLTS